MTTPFYELQEFWSLLLDAPLELREEWWSRCKSEYPSMWKEPMVRKCVAAKYNTWKRQEAIIREAGLEPLKTPEGMKSATAGFLTNPLWLLAGALAIAFVFSNTGRRSK